MKKHWKKILVAAIAAAVWFSTYTITNRFFDELNDKTISRIDEIGVMVEFGENKINRIDSSGYSIKIDGVEFYEHEEYCDLIGLAPEDRRTVCDVVAAVTVTLHNADNESEEAGVLFTELLLHSNTNTYTMGWDMLQTANPLLGNSYGITMAPGMTRQFVLPFAFREWVFPPGALEHLEDLDLWLLISSHPEQISIRVQ